MFLKHTAAIAAGVVVPVVAIGIAASVAIWKRHLLKAATKQMMAKIQGAGALSSPSPGTVSKQPAPAKSSWTRAGKPGSFDHDNL